MIVAIYIRRFSKWVISLLVTFLSHVIRVSKWLLANLPKLYGVITSTPMADITILFIGLPSSGKSSILYYIKLNEYVFTVSNLAVFLQIIYDNFQFSNTTFITILYNHELYIVYLCSLWIVKPFGHPTLNT